MKNALPETLFIYMKLLNNEQKKQIDLFLKEINVKEEKYNTESLWLMDQQIGGIGGYCMPSDPTVNPFPKGLERELFRSLQYARSEIDYCDIRIHSRYVVHYSGMHLEAVLKLFLKNKKVKRWLIIKNFTLGKATHEITKMNLIDEEITEALFKFIVLYNKAKHEVNMASDRLRLFSSSDAVVSYFAARIIGQSILAEIKYPGSLEIQQINNEVLKF